MKHDLNNFQVKKKSSRKHIACEIRGRIFRNFEIFTGFAVTSELLAYKRNFPDVIWHFLNSFKLECMTRLLYL